MMRFFLFILVIIISLYGKSTTAELVDSIYNLKSDISVEGSILRDIYSLDVMKFNARQCGAGCITLEGSVRNVFGDDQSLSSESRNLLTCRFSFVLNQIIPLTNVNINETDRRINFSATIEDLEPVEHWSKMMIDCYQGEKHILKSFENLDEEMFFEFGEAKKRDFLYLSETKFINLSLYKNTPVNQTLGKQDEARPREADTNNNDDTIVDGSQNALETLHDYSEDFDGTIIDEEKDSSKPSLVSDSLAPSPHDGANDSEGQQKHEIPIENYQGTYLDSIAARPIMGFTPAPVSDRDVMKMSAADELVIEFINKSVGFFDYFVTDSMTKDDISKHWFIAFMDLSFFYGFMFLRVVTDNPHYFGCFFFATTTGLMGVILAMSTFYSNRQIHELDIKLQESQETSRLLHETMDKMCMDWDILQSNEEVLSKQTQSLLENQAKSEMRENQLLKKLLMKIDDSMGKENTPQSSPQKNQSPQKYRSPQKFHSPQTRRCFSSPNNENIRI